MIARPLDAGEQARHTHVSTTDRLRARVVVVPVLTRGATGMTLGRWILVRRGHEHDQALLAHELVHLRQWRELGVARFLTGYLRAYGRGRWRGFSHREAYEAIPHEREARAIAGR